MALLELMLCSDTKFKMVEHEVRSLTSALDHIGQVNKTADHGEGRSVLAVSREVDLFRAGA